MDKASEALADVRGWLCDNLSEGDAGRACGMLSVVSRHIVALEDENARLRSCLSDDAENARQIMGENAKLRESVRNLLTCAKHEECEESCPNYEPTYTDYGYERNGSTVVESEYLGCCTVGLENCNSMFFDTDEYLRELGIEEES